jgi:hypothetical protein
MTRNVLWVVAALACLCAVSGWGLLRLDADAHLKRSATREPRSVEGEFTARLDELEAENKQVRHDLAQTRLAAENLSQKLDSAAVTRSPGDAQDPLKEDRAGLGERQTAGMVLLEEELQARTTAEAPDRVWAGTVEDAFRRALDGLEGGPVFESARCGSSLCAVVVTQADDQAHMNLVNALQGKTQEFGGQFLARRHPDPAGGYRTTFYLSRPGERIPDLKTVLKGEY